jgi:hypothetical protein
MKCIVLVLLLSFTCHAWSNQHAECQLVDRTPPNSSEALHSIKFQTLVDIFSVSNAKTLTMNLDGENLRLFRTGIEFDQQTRLQFTQRRQGQATHEAEILLDRTPKDAWITKEFYGKMSLVDLKRPNRTLNYNLYCRF